MQTSTRPVLLAFLPKSAREAKHHKTKARPQPDTSSLKQMQATNITLTTANTMASEQHDDAWTDVSSVDVTDLQHDTDATTPKAQATGSQVELDAEPATTYLARCGLERYTDRIVELTDAESVGDLRLLTDAMVESLITEAGLKLVSAEKLRRAIASLLPTTSDEKLVDAPVAENTPSHEAPKTEPPAEALAQEAIAIAIDRSGSMGTPFAELSINVVEKAVAQRTRMEAVKAMFYAFRDRIDSLGATSAHQVGLVQFDNEVETLCPMTSQLDRFEAIVDDMTKRGQTAIFSAIIEGARMLTPVFTSAPATDLRVLVLTDGQSNSGASPQAALTAVNHIGAVVDAIIVGDRPDASLRKIVAATGGLCFQINSLGEGFELLEGEGVASLHARRGGVDRPPFTVRPPADFEALEVKAMSTTAPVATPGAGLAARKVAPLATHLATIDARGGGGAAAGVNQACVKRALDELRKVGSGSLSVWMHSGEGVHIYPSEDDLTAWRALIEGPPDSPFAGGVFTLGVSLPAGYPFQPPSIRFDGPVPYHCNVSDAGSICLRILKEDWNPTLSVPKALEAIRVMLKHPDTDDALRQWIAELTVASKKHGGADTRYPDEAKRRTVKEAGRTVTEWEVEWGAVSAKAA